MADSASSPTTPHGSGGHVKIVIGLVIGLILGIAGNCLQKPDLGGGWVQKAFGGIVGVVDRSLPKSEASEPEGAARGRVVAFVVSVAEPIGKLFLRIMQMMVLPLVRRPARCNAMPPRLRVAGARAAERGRGSCGRPCTQGCRHGPLACGNRQA